MKVYLNDQAYELAENTGVTRSPMVEWPDNIRLDGQQQRKDRRMLSSWSIDDWSGGLGVNEIKHTSQTNRIWDAENVDTRFNTQMVLSPAFNTCTIVPSNGLLNLVMEHLGNIYFVSTRAGDVVIGTTNPIPPVNFPEAFKFTPPFTIGSFSKVGQTYYIWPGTTGNYSAGSISGVYTSGNRIAVVARVIAPNYPDNNRLMVFGGIGSMSIGSNAASMSMIGTYTNSNLFAQIVDVGGTLHILRQIDSNAILSIVDAQNWNTVEDVATNSTIFGSYLTPLVTDGLSVYAQLPEGIYNFDNTPAVEIDTRRAQDRNGAMELFQNALYFKNKKSIMRYDGTDITSIGYDRNDGLVSEKMGEVTAKCSSWQYMFAAVKGATYSHILAMDSSHAWQYYARVPSPGLWVRKMFISDAPDAIDRLWIMYGNYQYPGYFLNPMVNPLQAATYSFVPTGHVTLPNYGGDLPEEPGAFYDVIYNLGGMGGSNILTSQYSINGGGAIATLGVIATNSDVNMLGSPYGISANTIQPKFILAGANSGTSPQVKQVIYHYLKDPDKRETFEFTIDLNRTADSEVISKESLIGSLNYTLGLKPLVPFWYGLSGTRQVKIINMPAGEMVKDQKIFEGEREGLISVVVGEII